MSIKIIINRSGILLKQIFNKIIGYTYLEVFKPESISSWILFQNQSFSNLQILMYVLVLLIFIKYIVSKILVYTYFITVFIK